MSEEEHPGGRINRRFQPQFNSRGRGGGRGGGRSRGRGGRGGSNHFQQRNEQFRNPEAQNQVLPLTGAQSAKATRVLGNLTVGNRHKAIEYMFDLLRSQPDPRSRQNSRDSPQARPLGKQKYSVKNPDKKSKNSRNKNRQEESEDEESEEQESQEQESEEQESEEQAEESAFSSDNQKKLGLRESWADQEDSDDGLPSVADLKPKPKKKFTPKKKPTTTESDEPQQDLTV